MEKFECVRHPDSPEYWFYHNAQTHVCVWDRPQVLGPVHVPPIAWEDSIAYQMGIAPPALDEDSNKGVCHGTPRPSPFSFPSPIPYPLPHPLLLPSPPPPVQCGIAPSDV